MKSKIAKARFKVNHNRKLKLPYKAHDRLACDIIRLEKHQKQAGETQEHSSKTI